MSSRRRAAATLAVAVGGRCDGDAPGACTPVRHPACRAIEGVVVEPAQPLARAPTSSLLLPAPVTRIAIPDAVTGYLMQSAYHSETPDRMRSPAWVLRAGTAATADPSTGSVGSGREDARYWFLDRGAPDFVADWDGALGATVALLCSEAGRYPYDKALRELIGELSTVSAESAPVGPPTTCAATTVGSDSSGTLMPDLLNSSTSRWTCPSRFVTCIRRPSTGPRRALPTRTGSSSSCGWAAPRLKEAEPADDRDLP